MAAVSLARQAAGEKLSSKHVAALRRVTKLFASAAIEGAYRAVPKKSWVKWSGRTHQQIAEQGLRHSLPLVGPTIDLEKLAPAIHELLARRETPGKRKKESRAMELIRREELLLKRMERLAKQRVLLERQSVHETFQLVAEILRKAGAAVLDQFGADAHSLIDESLAESIRLVRAMCVDEPDPDD